ncbi:alpha-1,6-mannosyl-glycoprotein 2-beta-N-acetylglucosaminyltransferase [Copidosoma floridanum]|uniref:alpha-1,6-mannosyl-glycoprotein 2-beta-N-acetylglucosaminyltransferase n=1 Tax=Copidosoma floridanum TaxID=29053 RepID=UPI0006C948CF|nr:alpha-1,6-mannosyl-glycoprotein 2-beta-N-acetylglucosaminyltransferase [Copidosoma floridanum]XP_023245866.1 alpha-1,6-mannosyl-glycoprotein 2-beta-N-acetylglucosaminyltransferase [Copidosoma floridanum]
MRGSAVAVGVPRANRGFLFRTLAFVFLATFLWLQLHVINLTTRDWSNQHPVNESLYALVPQELHRFLKDRRNNGTLGRSNNLTSGNQELNEYEIVEIHRQIDKVNAEQRVLNEDAFGPLAPEAPVILVQVHDRLNYLRHLIISLAQAKGIEEVLLVFSHDVWNPDINYLVQNVDFCRVMQIFYPHSIQTHPHSFPGESPNDCPRNIGKEQALLQGCTNAEHPDSYKHYREAKFTQTKHHWWWKANRIFDQLNVTRNHTGMVLFLEEDHYVAEDFLHVLRLMERTCQRSEQRCDVLSLGTYLKTYNYYADNRKYLGSLQKDLLRGLKRQELASGTAGSPIRRSATTANAGGGSGQELGSTHPGQKVVAAPSWAYQLLPSLYQHYQKAEITPWVSSKHNMGMAFNRATWKHVRRRAKQFCTYDDYNWDWSLQHIAQTCFSPDSKSSLVPCSGLITIMMRAPRVFHIGECGVHHKKANCESTSAIAKLQNVLRQARQHLYPSDLTLIHAAISKKTKLRRGNGGWGDVRDHELCLNMTLEASPALIEL